jgi:hypothetical protein
MFSLEVKGPLIEENSTFCGILWQSYDDITAEHHA